MTKFIQSNVNVNYSGLGVSGLIALVILFMSSFGVSDGQCADEVKGRVERLVNQAIVFYHQNGKEKAFSEITKHDGTIRDNELYVFVYDMKGNVMAHGNQEKSVGKNVLNEKDMSGNYYVKDRLDLMANKDTAWQTYDYIDPISRKRQKKVSFLRKVDNYVFGSGYYLSWQKWFETQ